MATYIDTLESTKSSQSKSEFCWKFIEDLDFPLVEKDFIKIKGIFEIISTENLTEVPSHLTEKLLSVCRFCISHYENPRKGSHPLQYKKNIKLFYHLLQKIATMKYILFGCYACDKVFKSKAYLQSHIKRRHTLTLLNSLSSSVASHLSSIPFSHSTPNLNLTGEINFLLSEQQKIKSNLNETLNELTLDSPRLKMKNLLTVNQSRSYQSVEGADFQNFLKEISSKPSSPPVEEHPKKPFDLLLAAHALDLDPVTDTHYLYIAKQFLNRPLPKDWKVAGDFYENVVKGKRVRNHPGIKYYKKLVKVMKNRKENLIEKMKNIIGYGKVVLTQKYRKGVKTVFQSDGKEILERRQEIQAKVEEQIQKLGKVTMKMILNIDKETAKRFQVSDELVQCANMIESEAIILKEHLI